ncbi:MAG: LptF/LptG family permease [Armatimonadetes bacterium]|nr:LptF/LptG family permease [Armatimonadota bacterium]
MFKTVDRLVCKEIIPPLLFGIAAFTSLFFAGSYLGKLTNLLLQGVPISVVLKLFALNLPGIVVLTLPMSVLLGVLLSFARLSSDSEMVALWAGGVSLWRLMRPVLAIALSVSVLSFVINNWIAPGAARRSADLKARALKEATAIENPFVQTDKQDGRFSSIIVVNGGMKNHQLWDVSVVTGFGPGGPNLYFHAERAVWEGGDKWILYNGIMKTLGTGRESVTRYGQFKSQPITIQGTPEEIAEAQRDSDEMSFTQLARRIQRLRSVQDTRPLEVDLYNKIALPLASLVFALIAAPLGLRPQRSGSGVGFGLSIGLIFAYWMVWQYTSQFAKTSNLAPIAGSFMANLIFLGVGVALLIRKAR